MSLPQMRNLRFQFELHPDKALLSSSVLGIWDVKLKVAPSSHLVLDFLDLSRLIWNVRFDKHKKSSFLTYFKHYEYGFHQKTQGSSSQKEVPEKLAFAMDDEWVTDEANVELIRIHKQVRKAKYEPKDEFMPIPLEFLDTKRKTIMEFYRARVLSRKMVGVPVSFLRPSLLSLGKVGPSLGYLLVVSRVGPWYLLRFVILPEARRDHQRISLAKANLKTAQKEQEQPEAFHKERYRLEGEFAPREAFHRGRNPR